MARKSKVELSPHYNEIVDLLLDGYTGRSVSAYLDNQYGEKISHVSITKFKNNKLNIEEAIKTHEILQRKQNGEDTSVEKNSVDNSDKTPGEIAEEKINAVAENNATVQAKFINKINSGIDTLNMIREGIAHAYESDLLINYFDDDSIPDDKKVNTLINLSKMDLDWMKNNDIVNEVNVNNTLNDLIDDNLINEIMSDEKDVIK